MRESRALVALCVVVGATLLCLLPAAGASSARRGAVLHGGAGLSTNYDFARLVLDDGGWPKSANNVTFLTQWLRAEEPVEHWWNRANPLNNGLGSGGGSGLGSYRTVVVAAYYVARNLQRAAYGYPLVANDLARSATPSATARATWRSHWAGGHYGWGAGWGTTPVTSVAAPPAAWQSPTACPIRYPAHVVGPCGAAFTATGAAWHAGAPSGYRGEELWAFSGRAGARSTARWSPALGAGTYAVAAFLPARFDDAEVTYVVTDARGVHHVRVNQEPYADTWLPLGRFAATASSSISVLLTAPSRGTSGARYAAADAMRFTPARPSTPAPTHATSVVPRRAARLPGAPENVAAVAGDASATVTWLAPSKDGGSAVRGYAVATAPGGHTCTASVRASGGWSCTVHGLDNGRTYVFSVRASNRLGLGAPSRPSSPVRPLGVAALRLTAGKGPLVFGERVVVRAVVVPAAANGSVLFYEDGRALRGCQTTRVARGRASCALRFTSAGPHVLLASFTGSSTLSGVGRSVQLLVGRATTAFRAAATPVVVAPGAIETLRVWRLPGLASGKVVFSAGQVRLCVATVRSGGGSCAAKVALPVGVHVVVGRYVGDRNYLASTARTSLRVSAPAPTS